MKALQLLCLSCLFHTLALAQNSILVNMGSTTCTNQLNPSLSFIKFPLTPAPILLSNCSLTQQLPDYYSVYTAYNPKDNKVYVADIRTGQTRTWVVDMGLPGSLACPASLPAQPNYVTNYVSNHFEFDNNGDLWSLASFNPTNGTCNIDEFDLVNGTVISTRVLQFPPGNAPDVIESGDLAILPNGRMFAVLGSSPSRLYEIINYRTSQASALFLTSLPRSCFAISYLNGELLVAGTNLVNACYGYRYSLATQALGVEQPFMLGQAPIDNTSITPALGSAKQLISAQIINPLQTELTYEVYVQNMGNVKLNDFNISDDLAQAFGAANVGPVTVSFTADGNAAGLSLNPAYNGTTQTDLLTAGQSLNNQVDNSTDYFVKLRITAQVFNMQQNVTYYNSAVGRATINNAVDQILITDSSNNGGAGLVDPNLDGNASGPGENVPTPYNPGVLPLKFLKVNAKWNRPQLSQLNWQVSGALNKAKSFTVYHSTDQQQWQQVETVSITDVRQADYTAYHATASPVNYYRIRQMDIDGRETWSPTVLLSAGLQKQALKLFPNPSSSAVWIQVPEDQAHIRFINSVGQVLFEKTLSAGLNQIGIAVLPVGLYQVVSNGPGGTGMVRFIKN